ncbi:MAG: hypothetical protein M1834_000399 [Cirrosporium novae-zelandiae]|nr:MAG: hypothetical protein M1834_000399 [Cirrosporium novae-zelandiae]
MDTSYLTTQIGNIIDQLHGLFDDIGVPNHERNTRETELYKALSDALQNHLRHVTSEKNDMIEEVNNIIKTIKQMATSLNDNKNGKYDLNDDELKVSFPLTQCLQSLKEKHNSISRIHRERYEQVKKLVEALQSYSSHLEPSFVKIPLPPTSTNGSCPPTFDLSPSYVEALDNEFTSVYEEYMRRVDVTKKVAEEIVKLWAELGTPQAQTDGAIVKNWRDTPEQLGLHEDDIIRLQSKRDRLSDEKKSRERKLKDLKTTIEGLWDRLGVEERDRKAFLAANRGCGLRNLNEFDRELNRLNELKRQNLHLFVEDARCKLQELWDALYFSEEEMLDFTPAFSDVCSDALLSAHEAEIERLEALKEQRTPTLHLIDRHRSILQDKEALAASSQDASRLTARGAKGERRDPTRLLREEKMRKRITKELPKVEAELRKALERWEDEYGRPFLVHGERYLDELTAPTSRAPPPRPKTAAGHRPPTRMGTTTTTTTVPTKTGSPTKRPGHSSSNSVPSRANSVPSRAGAKTPTGRRTPGYATVKTPTSTYSSGTTYSSSTYGGNTSSHNLASSTSSGGRTPSRIPARVPLGSMRQSPERRPPLEQHQPYAYGTMRKMGPPKAPPPRMRDIFQIPKEQPSHENSRENLRPASVLSSSDGSVRHIEPEDIYDDRSQRSYLMSSTLMSSTIREATPQTWRDLHNVSAQGYYPSDHHSYDSSSNSGSRQFSNSTTTNTAATSGSENWETFDDNSEPEEDATEAYYAKVKAAQSKRYTPHGGYGDHSGGKKLKGGYAGAVVIDDETGRVVSGSDAGWTDDGSAY